MKRLQRKRTRGWRMLPNSRCVNRSSRWGNPYAVWHWSKYLGWATGFDWEGRFDNRTFCDPEGKYWTKEQATQKAIELYREYATERAKREPEWLDPLRGLDNLYCTCPEGAPCHGDVLIELLEEV